MVGLRLVAAGMVLAMTGGTARADRLDDLRTAASLLPDVASRELADRAAEAAFVVETDTVPAELLLAMSWAETRLDPTVRTGRVCGISGVSPADIDLPMSRCVLWAVHPSMGMEAAITELKMMLADRRVGGDLRRALMYRACGNSYFAGTCRKGDYAGWILRMASHIGSVKDV